MKTMKTIKYDDLLFQKFVAFTTAVHQVKHELTKDIRMDAVTPQQYSILEYVTVSQPVTLSEISDCLHISMPNTSRELKKLGEKGLCAKMPDEHDRRKQVVRLTEQGSELMGGIFGQIRKRTGQRLGSLSAQELLEIERAMDLLQQKVFY